jgi:hypothetical protein
MVMKSSLKPALQSLWQRALPAKLHNFAGGAHSHRDCDPGIKKPGAFRALGYFTTAS